MAPRIELSRGEAGVVGFCMAVNGVSATGLHVAEMFGCRDVGSSLRRRFIFAAISTLRSAEKWKFRVIDSI